MNLKKYTLYFKGKNKYGNIFDYPIISLNLKDMDMYTSNYRNYNELLNSLPSEVLTFIKDELSYEINFDSNDNLENLFFITDNDFNPIIDVIFNGDKDVLYVEPKELEELMVKKLMTLQDFEKSLLKTNHSSELKKSYDFFAYLYNNYVKDKPIKCMIDDYDIKKYSLNLNEDDIMIASIATDKDNLIVLSKKLAQTLESRRNLAFELKKAFKMDSLLADTKMELRKVALQVNTIFSNMKDNLKSFQIKYNEE